ncbi:MAG: alginate lyase family protein, partial [Paludibacter sp.]
MYKKIAFIFSIICSVSMYAQPRIWNMQSIDNAKSLNSEAAKYVIREADKYLITKLVTVMDKPMTPPSGDKHDYMSMGRYWWPDPKKADGLPYIRKDGVVNREIDKLDRMP